MKLRILLCALAVCGACAAQPVNGSAGVLTVANPAEYSNGTCTTAATISAANGNRQKVTLTAGSACALTFTQPSSGTGSIQLKVIQSASSAFNGSISTTACASNGVCWPAGITPTITTTTGAIDVLSCYLDGTKTYCVPSQDFR